MKIKGNLFSRLYLLKCWSGIFLKYIESILKYQVKTLVVPIECIINFKKLNEDFYYSHHFILGHKTAFSSRILKILFYLVHSILKSTEFWLIYRFRIIKTILKITELIFFKFLLDCFRFFSILSIKLLHSFVISL